VWVENWPGGQETWPKLGCHRRRYCVTRREAGYWILAVGLVLTSYRRYSANPGGPRPNSRSASRTALACAGALHPGGKAPRR